MRNTSEDVRHKFPTYRHYKEGPVPFGFLPEKNGFSIQMESIPFHWSFSPDYVTTKTTEKGEKIFALSFAGAVIKVTCI